MNVIKNFHGWYKIKIGHQFFNRLPESNVKTKSRKNIEIKVIEPINLQLS